MNQLVNLPAIAIAAIAQPVVSAPPPRGTDAGWKPACPAPGALLAHGRVRRARLAQSESAAPVAAGVHRLFEAHAQRMPTAAAIRTDAGTWTYGRLNAAANALARRLRRHGVRPGDAVATVLERSARLVAAALAIVKCGATHVPLDPQAPSAWLAAVLADSGATAVLTDAALLPRLPAGLAPLAINGARRAGALCNLDVEAPAGVPAALLYGVPAPLPLGHALPHATLARLAARNGYAEFRSGDCVAFAGGSPADVGGLELWGPLLCGASIAILAPQVGDHALAAALYRHRVTVLFIASPLLDRCAGAIAPALADLRVLLAVGTRPDAGSLSAVLARGTDVDIRHCYGSGAALACALAHRVRRDAPLPQHA